MLGRAKKKILPNAAVHFGFLIEGNNDQELPENLLGIVGMESIWMEAFTEDYDFEKKFKGWSYLYHGTKSKHLASILTSGFRGKTDRCWTNTMKVTNSEFGALNLQFYFKPIKFAGGIFFCILNGFGLLGA